MSYIGRDLRTGAFRQLDDISSSFNSSTTGFTMQVNSTNVSLGDVNQIILSLGGVIQKPGTDFTISGSTLTFTTAPAANTSFFAILLGSDNGGTVTPTDGSVTGDKLASTVTTSSNITTTGTTSLDGAVTINDSSADVDFRVETNGNANMFLVDGGNDAVIFNGSTSNFASGSQAVQIYNSGLSFTSGYGIQGGANTDRASVNLTSGASGHIVFKANNSEVARISADGEMTKSLQPCFRIGSGTQDNIPVTTNNDVVFSNEIFDVGNNFASNTFTAPVTGKYYLNAMFRINNLDTASSYLQVVILGSNRNTTIFTLSDISDHMSGDSEISFSGATILDMDANDTASVRIRIQAGTAQADLNNDGSYFTGYLIG